MFGWIKMKNKDLKNHFAMTVFSWKKWLVGKLANHKKSFANYKKNQSYQYLMGSWQVGNFQLNFPTCQLSITHCYYWSLHHILVGEKTPILRIGIALTLIPIRCVKFPFFACLRTRFLSAFNQISIPTFHRRFL